MIVSMEGRSIDDIRQIATGSVEDGFQIIKSALDLRFEVRLW